MIRDNRASLSVHSDVRTVAEISQMLGIEPDESGDIGELTPGGRAGRNLAPERLRYQSTYWSVTEKDDGTDEDDQTGFAALRRLVARLTPHAPAVAELARHEEATLWWSGGSDSWQGGFVLQADLIDQLSALGCHVFGTAFLHVGDE